MSATVARRGTNGKRRIDVERMEMESAVEGDGTLASSATAAEPAAAGGGRDGRGRFTAGNLGGPGNPFARQTAQLRSALIQRMTMEDMNVIADELILQARNGRLHAIKLLFQYIIGKPTVAVNPDTLDVEEFQQIYAPRKQIWEMASESMQCVPPRECSILMKAGNEVACDEMARVLEMPKAEFEAHKTATDAATAPSTKGANGSGTEEDNGRRPSINGASGPGTRQERGRPPSRNGAGEPAAPLDRAGNGVNACLPGNGHLEGGLRQRSKKRQRPSTNGHGRDDRRFDEGLAGSE